MANELYEKKGYLLEDFRLFHLRGAQGVKAEYHYHEFCKLLLLVSGSGGYRIAGQQYALQAGDIVLVGSRAVHRPEFQPNAPYERIIVYIDPEFLRRQSTADCDLNEIFSGKQGHVLRCEKWQRLLNLALSLENALSGQEFGHIILSNGLLLRLLVEIGREQRRSDVQRPASIVPKDTRILQLMQYVDAHIAEDISIDALAEQFYLSKYHMMHLFRTETGQSIYNYLIQQRLGLARSLISGGMRATEAAFRSGFATYSS
ncbi:MAG: AraC family ligand binding domain-containing protein, partial [Oscillospiraceae bacterium]|nr:AraC family ligand binding domain-containing protein [Oscillospiraceae bacterium]